MIATASKPIRKRRQTRAHRCTFKNAYTRFFTRVQYCPNLYAGAFAMWLALDPDGESKKALEEAVKNSATQHGTLIGGNEIAAYIMRCIRSCERREGDQWKPVGRLVQFYYIQKTWAVGRPDGMQMENIAKFLNKEEKAALNFQNVAGGAYDAAESKRGENHGHIIPINPNVRWRTRCWIISFVHRHPGLDDNIISINDRLIAQIKTWENRDLYLVWVASVNGNRNNVSVAVGVWNKDSRHAQRLEK